MALETLSIEEARRVALLAQGLRGPRARRAAVCRPCCAGSARCSSTRSRCWPGPTSWWPTPARGRSGAPGSSGPTGGRRARRSSTGPHAACVAAAGGLAGLRVQAQGPAGQGEALARARGARQDLRRGGGPPARRRPADRERAGRRQEGRTVVGLVRDEDRRRVAARHRRAGLPRASGLPARLRPGRARRARRPPGPGMDGRGVRRAAGRRGRALARRGDRSRPGRVPRAAAPARAAGAAVHRPGRGRRWRAGRRAPTPIPPRWRRSARGPGAGTSSCRPSTRSSGTGSGWSGCSACATGSRPTPRRTKRVYGYFAMPVLAGTSIVGLVDPGRRDDVARGQAGDAPASGGDGRGGAGAGRGGLLGRVHARSPSSAWSPAPARTELERARGGRAPGSV